jgi:S-DNA-T family DNA segregation ATPase FtsK/SpoIIIE
MKRYRLFSEENTRDIDTYNTLMLDRQRAGGENKPLPRIIVIIDELADLMMVAAKEVEDSICRVAQMGRAAGIHLVVATQSPRADVITGLIKANIPSRCALKVSSSLESRIILDSGGGAEKLIGNGDMLYAPIGTNKPKRIQGTWVSDEEREAVIEYLKEHAGGAEYDDEMIAEMDRLAENKSGGKAEDAPSGNDSDPFSDYDEVLPEAVDVALDAGQVSVSMLQRRLKLGYSRAARVVDQMEELGVIGPYEGAKPRQVLISRAQWQEMQMIQGTAPADTLPPEPEDPFPDYESGDDFPPYEGGD